MEERGQIAISATETVSPWPIHSPMDGAMRSVESTVVGG